ncbi:MAG: DUF4832 domain-containing protein [Phycisphaerae bacterium]|jgi:hypothetical protein
MSLSRFPVLLAVLSALLSALLSATVGCGGAQEVVVKPKPYDQAIRNPMKGFIDKPDGIGYVTLSRPYVAWSDLESSAGDGADKIVRYSNAMWKDIPQRNVKVIPRVYLEWPIGSPGDEYWPIQSYYPSDMTVRDFTSAKFKARAVRMVEKMAQAWDNDDRIAFIEMAMIGPWGEHHDPAPTEAIQKVLGDAFTANFKHKLVMVRYPWHFEDYKFGIHWDSFGKPGWESRTHIPLLEGPLADRWKIAPMGGEMAYHKGEPANTQLGLDPTDTAANYADTVIRYIHRWHWTTLGWMGNHDANNAAASANAERFQKAFGYRYVLDECRYDGRVRGGGRLNVSFTVRNVGSAPFYYTWPVEVSLLDANTHQPAWKSTFKNVDIRTWLPGNFSDIGKGKMIGQDKQTHVFQWATGIDYDIPPQPTTVSGSFQLPTSLPAGRYILALAILDPAGDLPSLRFATANYFTGGRHPIGWVGLDSDNPNPQLDDKMFDDLRADKTLHYVVDHEVK